MLSKETESFLNALRFLTIVPLGIDKGIIDKGTIDKGIDENYKGTAKYFPLVSVFIGVLSLLVINLLNLVLPLDLSILLGGIVFPIILTGALHQDGLGDFCDGFGGGGNKKDILKIMQDHNLGTYGTLGLTLNILIDYVSLILLGDMGTKNLIGAILLGNATSMVLAISYISSQDYARSSGLGGKDREGKDREGKSAIFEVSKRQTLVQATTLIITIIILYKWSGLFIVFLQIILWYALGTFVKRRIGGYTGDTLGATIVFSKSLLYLSLLIISIIS